MDEWLSSSLYTTVYICILYWYMHIIFHCRHNLTTTRWHKCDINFTVQLFCLYYFPHFLSWWQFSFYCVSNFSSHSDFSFFYLSMRDKKMVWVWWFMVICRKVLFIRILYVLKIFDEKIFVLWIVQYFFSVQILLALNSQWH